MSDVTSIDSARLSVLLDLRQPLAYIALQPTIDLAREEGLDVNWLPVRVPPLRAPGPENPGAEADRGTRHRRFRARAVAREVETYADAQGLVLRDLYRDPDPSAAHAAWLWARAQARDRLEDVITTCFRAYWAGDLDPPAPAAVADGLEASGLDAAAFLAWFEDEGEARLAEVEADLRDRGMAVGAPVYWTEGELFWGGQHLEMIRWILRGRSGPGPI